MSIRIEILENNTVELFKDNNEIPFIRQPQWPNGTEWASAAEAGAWAEEYVESIEVKDAPYASNGPGLSRLPKPTEEEVAAKRAEVEAELERRANPVLVPEELPTE